MCVLKCVWWGAEGACLLIGHAIQHQLHPLPHVLQRAHVHAEPKAVQQLRSQLALRGVARPDHHELQAPDGGPGHHCTHRPQQMHKPAVAPLSRQQQQQQQQRAAKMKRCLCLSSVWCLLIIEGPGAKTGDFLRLQQHGRSCRGSGADSNTYEQIRIRETRSAGGLLGGRRPEWRRDA